MRQIRVPTTSTQVEVRILTTKLHGTLKMISRKHQLKSNLLREIPYDFKDLSIPSNRDRVHKNKNKKILMQKVCEIQWLGE